MKIFLVGGARPNFMKIAPLIHELNNNKRLHNNILEWKIVHTGQHYDYEMSKVFFDELNIPEPDYFLNVGSGTHAEQTARIMVEFEKVCLKEFPVCVVVVGDVNSTLACAITAKKLKIRVAHIEAGLRSNDMTMPEEINRIVTDSIADFLFVTEESGIANLKREGKRDDQIFFVGNIMIDTLFYGLKKLESVKVGNLINDQNGYYGIVTLHRPSNVDEKEKLGEILLALTEISKDMPLYFPMHPRTRKAIKKFRFYKIFKNSNLRIMPPLSYLQFLSIFKSAKLILTDSGGVQEEATVLGIPCFTLRENTERPITVEEGTNIIVGTSRKRILEEYEKFKNGLHKKGKIPKLWDGKTAERIVNILEKILI